MPPCPSLTREMSCRGTGLQSPAPPPAAAAASHTPSLKESLPLGYSREKTHTSLGKFGEERVEGERTWEAHTHCPTTVDVKSTRGRGNVFTTVVKSQITETERVGRQDREGER